MIWILWHKRVGDLNQMVTLAKSIGLPYEIKRLEFQKPHYAPLSRLLLRNREILNAPAPQLVISAEAMCSPIAHELKRMKSVKTVALARPLGDPRHFDLVLTTAQYGLVGDNVVILDLPLTAGPLLQEAEKSHSREGDFSVVVLVGGSAPPEILDETSAEVMCEDLKDYKNIRIVTSPRTPMAIANIFAKHFQQTHIWQKDKANPYAEALASASQIIVTSDSVSMLADALVQHVPVQIYRLPKKLTWAQRAIVHYFRRRPNSLLFRWGLIETTPNRTQLVERLVSQNYVSWFGEKQNSLQKFNFENDLAKAAQAIAKLF
jgi:uncharacterized protein